MTTESTDLAASCNALTHSYSTLSTNYGTLSANYDTLSANYESMVSQLTNIKDLLDVHDEVIERLNVTISEQHQEILALIRETASRAPVTQKAIKGTATAKRPNVSTSNIGTPSFSTFDGYIEYIKMRTDVEYMKTHNDALRMAVGDANYNRVFAHHRSNLAKEDTITKAHFENAIGICADPQGLSPESFIVKRAGAGKTYATLKVLNIALADDKPVIEACHQWYQSIVASYEAQKTANEAGTLTNE